MSRWVLVDDTDSGIQYTGSWFQDQGTQNSLGNFGIPYESSLHGINSNGSLSYTFQGSAVVITGTVQFAATSNPSWVCSVDGVTVPSVQPSVPENRLLLCRQDSILDGSHNITVQVTSSDQRTFWFDYVQYMPSASVNLEDAALSVDYTDSQLDYGAGWEVHSPGQITSQAGSRVSFDFQGVSLTWFGFYDNTLSLSSTTASYSVDGQKPIAFNLDGSAAQATGVQYNQILFQTSQLSPGNHTIQVVYQGDSQTAPLSLNSLVIQSGMSTNITANETASAPGALSGAGAGPSATPFSSGTPGPDAATSASYRNKGAIIGGALGGLALLIALVMGLLFCCRRKRSKIRTHKYVVVDPTHAANQNTTSTTTAAGTHPSPNDNKALRTQDRYVVANSFAPIRLEPPRRSESWSSRTTSSIDLSHSTVVRDEDSGIRFFQTAEGGQVQVLPPDYTAV